MAPTGCQSRLVSPPAVPARENPHGATLLLTGAHAVGEGRRDAHVIELCGRLVEPTAPGLPRVQGDDRALIADERDDAGVVGVDPEILVVIATGRPAQRDPAAAAVAGFHGH